MRLSIRQYAGTLLDVEQSVAPEEVARVAERFASWLSRRGEDKKLSVILKEAERLAKERAGVTEVTFVSAHTLDEANETALKQRAEKIFPGKKIVAKFALDRELLGGVRIQSDEVLYDLSLQKAVRDLKTHLVK